MSSHHGLASEKTLEAGLLVTITKKKNPGAKKDMSLHYVKEMVARSFYVDSRGIVYPFPGTITKISEKIARIEEGYK